MDKKIGAVLARTFREVCEDSNSRARSDFSKISAKEIGQIESLLRNVDNPAFNLEDALRRHLKIAEE